MSDKSKLQKALEEQAAQLDAAQSGFVVEEFKNWWWNQRRIRQIEALVDSGVLPDGEELSADARRKLIDERHKLVTEAASLFSHIMRHIKGTGQQTDEFDDFMRG